jgi:hypothetical protein
MGNKPDPEGEVIDLANHDATYRMVWFDRTQIEREWPQTKPSQHPWPDFDKWDRQSEFRLYEVACLWSNQEPALPLSKEAKDCFLRLERAVLDRTLKVHRENLREVIADAVQESRGGQVMANPNWGVTRADLLSYALVADEKPRFLFPRERV